MAAHGWSRRLGLGAGLVCLGLVLANPRMSTAHQEAAATLPDVGTVIAAVREHFRQDPVRESRFTYLETRQRVDHDGSGRSRVVEESVYEVYPDEPVGRIYRRLIRRNGIPLTAEELARHDEARRKDLSRRRHESAFDRAERLRAFAEKQRENALEVDDALAVWNVTLTGFDMRDGRKLIKATLTPRPGARPHTRVGKYLQKVRGYAWLTADDYQLVRAELEVLSPINIGLGLVGRVHKGGRAVLERTLVDGTWMLTYARLEATGRAFLVKPVSVDRIYRYSKFRAADGTRAGGAARP